MALINCRNCGKQVSDRADRCPHCRAELHAAEVITEDRVEVATEVEAAESAVAEVEAAESAVAEVEAAPEANEPSVIEAVEEAAEAVAESVEEAAECVEEVAEAVVEEVVESVEEAAESVEEAAEAVVESVDEEIETAVEEEYEEEEYEEEEEEYEEEEPQPRRKWRWMILPLTFLIIAVATCALVYMLFATDVPQEAPQQHGVQLTAATSDSGAHTSAVEPVKEEVAVEKDVEQQPADSRHLEYGEWGAHIANFFRTEAIAYIGDGRYRVNTGDLCPRLNSCVNPRLEEGVATAVVFADKINMRSSASTSSSENIIHKLLFGDYVHVVAVEEGDWAKVEVMTDDESIVEGYVSILYLTDTARFELIKTHIAPERADRADISEAKWRRALAETMYNIGITATTPHISADVAKIYSGGDERVVVFELSRVDSEVKLLVALEFFKGNEEFRLLAIIPGSRVIEIDDTGDHTYDIKYVI